jgi:hypothetical protein
VQGPERLTDLVTVEGPYRVGINTFVALIKCWDDLGEAIREETKQTNGKQSKTGHTNFATTLGSFACGLLGQGTKFELKRHRFKSNQSIHLPL